MTIELWAVAWTGLLLLVLILLSAVGNVQAMGNEWGIGNREVPAKGEGWAGRAKRAYMNLMENLVVFAAAVVPAHIAGVHTSLTVLGAQLFLIGRIVHAVVYLGGWTFLALRTLAYFAGVAGTIMIFIALMTA
jgi:uncharacterized MAPEG superfamily protein